MTLQLRFRSVHRSGNQISLRLAVLVCRVRPKDFTDVRGKWQPLREQARRNHNMSRQHVYAGRQSHCDLTSVTMPRMCSRRSGVRRDHVWAPPELRTRSAFGRTPRAAETASCRIVAKSCFASPQMWVLNPGCADYPARLLPASQLFANYQLRTANLDKVSRKRFSLLASGQCNERSTPSCRCEQMSVLIPESPAYLN